MNELINSFDRMSKWFDLVFSSDLRRIPNLPTFDENWFSCGCNFPPVDVLLKENKDLEYRMAVAGYPKDSVDIEFDGDYMLVSAKARENIKTEKDKWLARGIKSSGFSVKFYVPYSRYDRENSSAEYLNGFLTITIPSKEKKDNIKVNIK